MLPSFILDWVRFVITLSLIFILQRMRLSGLIGFILCEKISTSKSKMDDVMLLLLLTHHISN